MNSILHRVAPIVTTLGLLVMPLSGRAAQQTAPKFTQAQLNEASAEVRQALKAQGVASIQAATPKQLAAAIAAVVAKHRRNKDFIAALTAALVQARPEMTGQIVQFILTDLTPPGGETPPYLVSVVVGAAAAENAATGTTGFGAAPAGVVIANPNDTATSNSSATTINPANISGSGSTTPVVPTTSPTTPTGG